MVYPIRLSGIFRYLAWLWNKGVRIIEVLLYMYILNLKFGALTASCVSEGLLGSHYSNLLHDVTVQPF